MIIRCNNCDFKLHVAGDGFIFKATEINFCPQCGLQYRKNGNDVGAIFESYDAWQRWISRTYKLYILLPIFSALLAFLSVPLVFATLPGPKPVLVALFIFFVDMIVTIFILERTAKKRFPEVYQK